MTRLSCHIIGYTREEIVGNLCARASHPENCACEAALIAQLVNTQLDASSWEQRYLRKDGSAVWCTLRLSPLGLQGNGLRQFIGLVEDISEKKHSEISLQRSQAMLRIAGTTAKLGGWILDVPGDVLHWADEVRALHEVAGDFELTLAQAVDFCPPEFRGQVMASIKHCEQDGTPFNFEHELVTAQGKRLWVLAMGEAVRDD